MNIVIFTHNLGNWLIPVLCNDYEDFVRLLCRTVQRAVVGFPVDAADPRAGGHDAAARSEWSTERTSSLSDDQRHLTDCQTNSRHHTQRSRASAFYLLALNLVNILFLCRVV